MPVVDIDAGGPAVLLSNEINAVEWAGRYPDDTPELNMVSEEGVDDSGRVLPTKGTTLKNKCCIV